MQEIELSSTPEPSRLGHLAYGQGLDAAATQAALRGLDELISPRRRMTLVHAVNLHAGPAVVHRDDFSRTTAGQTDVGIAGRLGIHRPTTDTSSLRSRWVDTIDDLTDDAPSQQVTKKVITDVTIAPERRRSRRGADGPRLDLGDTRRRTVSVLAESFCRFSRYFTERVEFACPGRRHRTNCSTPPVSPRHRRVDPPGLPTNR